jgi:hypothetical protein
MVAASRDSRVTFAQVHPRPGSAAALKTMRALAPVLDVRTEELAALVAGGDWATTGTSSYASAPELMSVGPLPDSPSYNTDKVLLSLERRLRDVPPLERIALLNEMIAAAVEELAGER